MLIFCTHDVKPSCSDSAWAQWNDCTARGDNGSDEGTMARKEANPVADAGTGLHVLINGEFWWRVAWLSPFVAALLLGFGTTRIGERSRTSQHVTGLAALWRSLSFYGSNYLWHLAVSILAVLAFGISLFMIGSLLS
jgi:hypothetical protein